VFGERGESVKREKRSRTGVLGRGNIEEGAERSTCDQHPLNPTLPKRIRQALRPYFSVNRLSAAEALT